MQKYLMKTKKILNHNYEERLLKALFIIYADLECLLEKMHLCQNNFEKSSTEKNKDTPSGYSIFTSCLFDSTKSRLDC